MAKFTFEDLSGTVAAMLWPEEYAKNEALIRDDTIVFLRGSMNRSRDPAELVVNRVIPIEDAAAQLARGMVVTLRKGVHQTDQIERLHRLIRSRPGHLDLYLEIMGLARVRRAIYKAGAGLKVRHDKELFSTLETVVGTGNVRLLGSRGATARIEPVAVTRPVAPEFADDELEEPDDD